MKSITSSKNSLSAGVRTDNLSIICVSILILLCLTIPLKRTLGVIGAIYDLVVRSYVLDNRSVLLGSVSQSYNGTSVTSKPINPPTIKYIAVDTFGIEYPEPERTKAFDYQAWLMKYYYGI